MFISQDVNLFKSFRRDVEIAGKFLIHVKDNEEAKKVLTKHEVGIAFLDCTDPMNINKSVIDDLIVKSKNPEIFMILMNEEIKELALFASSIKSSICDVLKLPLEKHKLNVKLKIYSRMFYSVQRVTKLMESTFPPKIIQIFRKTGYVKPKRYDGAVTIFTDFVNFSKYSSGLEPMDLLARLEKYFLKFDDICRRYHIEKIKTIGDAYMAIAGVTEDLPEPEIRTCLAALEMRQFVETEHNLLKAQGIEGWKVRIGINSGSLVGGIVGRDKIFYDVWGDSVNIAARAEQESPADEILITERIQEKVADFFETIFYNQVEIKRRGGRIPMYYLHRLKQDYARSNKGVYPNFTIMNKCQLSSIDFNRMRTDIIHFLKCYLTKELCYHTINRTLKIEKIIERYSGLLALDEHAILLLKTATLYHDIGYVVQYEQNEPFAIMLAKNKLPSYGYTQEDIQKIQSLIWITSLKATPDSIMEQLMRDVNFDYLGRSDYFAIANNLRKELRNHGKEMSNLEWIEFQINFLKHSHYYYTDLVRDLREKGKQKRIKELEEARSQLLQL